jgi:hypothetical protein
MSIKTGELREKGLVPPLHDPARKNCAAKKPGHSGRDDRVFYEFSGWGRSSGSGRFGLGTIDFGL